MKYPWVRIGLALLVPLAVVWLGPRVPLPRLDTSRLESALGGYAAQLSLSAFALGLSPVLSAFWLVELAALSVPPWRVLRTGGPSGRGRLLRATYWLGMALAFVQALGVTLYLERFGALEADPRLSRLLVVFTLVAGVALLVMATRFLDESAVGGGYSLLVTGFACVSLVQLREPLLASPSIVGGALLLTILGTVLVLRWRPAGGGLPLPACGLVPLQWTAAIAAGALAASGTWPEAVPGFASGQGAGGVASGLALSAGLAVALGFLFNRPSKVAAFGPCAPVGRAVGLSALYVVGLAVLGFFLDRQVGLPASILIPVVAAVAVVLDVVAEAAAFRRHGELVPVWPEHRLYAVDGALALLDRADIPSLARSVHQRVLWHFFAPFIPIQILVPRERAQEAGALLLDHFGRGTSGVSKVNPVAGSNDTALPSREP